MNSAHRLESPSRHVQNTNLIVAYGRSFSDIPNAKLLSDLAHAKEYTESIYSGGDLAALSRRFPYFESRYKAIDALIKASGASQVVEFAAGLTTRGVNNPEWNYIHTDQDADALRSMADINLKILGGAGRSIKLVKFDAIGGDGMQDITKSLREEPVAVVHEGLFRYYPPELKSKVANNAKLLLERYGGVYITPDVNSREMSDVLRRLSGYDASERIERLQSAAMDRDIDSFRFKDTAEMVGFMERMGFDVEVHTHRALVGRLSSARSLFSDDAKDIEDAIGSLSVLKMKLPS